jgi:hypothetical protein
MSTIIIDGISYTLTTLEKDIWNRLLNGALKPKDFFHQAVIATTNEKGLSMRTVVLRKVITMQKQLIFHTDIRSGKWKDMQNINKISWLFYNGNNKMQIRLSGTVSLHHNDALAANAWQKSNVGSRKIYTGDYAPSTKSAAATSGLGSNVDDNTISIEETEVGQKNFGVVITNIEWMDWLWLKNKGHRRANFMYNGNELVESNWLIP